MSSIVEEVAGLKQEQEAQRGDLIRINQSLKDLSEVLRGTTAAINDLSIKCEMLMECQNNTKEKNEGGITEAQLKTVISRQMEDIKASIPEFKQTIDNQDRKLMNNVMESLKRNTGDNKLVFYTCVVAVFLVAALSIWTQYKMSNEVEQVNQNYDLITSILSGDSHYWFDGENYKIGRESPSGEYFQKIYNEYCQRKSKV